MAMSSAVYTTPIPPAAKPRNDAVMRDITAHKWVGIGHWADILGCTSRQVNEHTLRNGNDLPRRPPSEFASIGQGPHICGAHCELQSPISHIFLHLQLSVFSTIEIESRDVLA